MRMRVTVLLMRMPTTDKAWLCKMSSSSTRRLLAASKRRWLSSSKTNDPIPFSQSKARAFRPVDDIIMLSEKEMRRGRYAVPLGLISFAALVYVGFIRKEPASDGASDKLPQAMRDAMSTKDKGAGEDRKFTSPLSNKTRLSCIFQMVKT